MAELDEHVRTRTERLLAESAVMLQLADLEETATQCTREYQDVIVQFDQQRALRNIGMAWIELGAQLVTLVVSCGTAVAAMRVYRGTSILARLPIIGPRLPQLLTSGEQMTAAARSAHQTDVLLMGTSRAVACGKELACPRWLAQVLAEMPVRVGIGVRGTAIATGLYGPVVLLAALTQGELPPAGDLVIGKVGVLRRSIEHRPEYRSTKPLLQIRESVVLSLVESSMNRYTQELRTLLQLPPEDVVSYISHLDYELMQAMKRDGRFNSLKENEQLYLRFRALLDYWERIMRETREARERQEMTVRECKSQLDRCFVDYSAPRWNYRPDVGDP